MGGFSAQRQFLVTVAGLDGKWMNKTGGRESAANSKVYDGGELIPENVAGPSETDNVTVSRGFKRDRDAAVLAKLRGKSGKWTTTITVQPTDADLVPVGKPTVYSNALLVGMSDPDYDSNGSDPAVIELEFAVGQAV